MLPLSCNKLFVVSVVCLAGVGESVSSSGVVGAVVVGLTVVSWLSFMDAISMGSSVHIMQQPLGMEGKQTISPS